MESHVPAGDGAATAVSEPNISIKTCVVDTVADHAAAGLLARCRVRSAH